MIPGRSPTTIPRCPGARPWFTVRLTDSQPRHLCCSTQFPHRLSMELLPAFVFGATRCRALMSAHPEASCIVSSVPPSPKLPPRHGLGDFSSGLRVSSANLIAVCASAKAERRQAPRKGGCAIQSWLPCLPSHGWLVAPGRRWSPTASSMEAALSFVLAPRCLDSALRCGCPPSFSRSCPVRYRVFVQTLSLVFAAGCNPLQLRLHCRINKTPPSPPRSHGPDGLLTSTTRSIRLACPGRAGCSWWNNFSLVNEDARRPPPRRALASP